jgi:hypothetical protein
LNIALSGIYNLLGGIKGLPVPLNCYFSSFRARYIDDIGLYRVINLDEMNLRDCCLRVQNDRECVNIINKQVML